MCAMSNVDKYVVRACRILDPIQMLAHQRIDVARLKDFQLDVPKCEGIFWRVTRPTLQECVDKLIEWEPTFFPVGQQILSEGVPLEGCLQIELLPVEAP